MSYEHESPDVAVLGGTEEGLPEVVQFTYDSGHTVSADYDDIVEDDVGQQHVRYDVSNSKHPLTVPRKGVQDAYDIVERLGEREGYQDNPDLMDEVDGVDTGSEEYGGEDTVSALLEDDRL